MSKIATEQSNRSLTTVIYVLCAAIAIVFAATNLGVLMVAGGQADAVRDRLEHQLLRDELSHLLDAAARSQAQISHWDNSVKALGGKISLPFVEKEIADWLWSDFGIRVTAVIDPADKVEVAVLEDEVVTGSSISAHVAGNLDLVRRARANFDNVKIAEGTGYTVKSDPFDHDKPLFAGAVRAIDGKLGVAVAQAIVPDNTAVLGPGSPKVLLTFKPLSPEALAEVGSHIGLNALRYVGAGEVPAKGKSTMVLPALSGRPPMVFQWTSLAPSSAVWKGTLPFLIGMFISVAAVLVVLARRYARVLGALQKSEAENRYRAEHDALTGLPNRQQFDAALDAALAGTSDKPCAVACLDLDKFKDVNDTYGHQVGDMVIQTAAERISRVVGNDGLAARLGGDEFIIMFTDYTSREHLRGVCNALIARLSEDILFAGGKTQIGASIGVAWAGENGETVKELVRAADEALYMAKDLGRGVTCLAGEKADCGCEPVLEKMATRGRTAA